MYADVRRSSREKAALNLETRTAATENAGGLPTSCPASELVVYVVTLR